eukprot:m.219119 g.219119  ORF g.219119 m.219119 type:complete len:271 (+) comp54132_c0_seq1:2058-2870(+)
MQFSGKVTSVSASAVVLDCGILDYSGAVEDCGVSVPVMLLEAHDPAQVLLGQSMTAIVCKVDVAKRRLFAHSPGCTTCGQLAPVLPPRVVIADDPEHEVHVVSDDEADDEEEEESRASHVDDDSEPSTVGNAVLPLELLSATSSSQSRLPVVLSADAVSPTTAADSPTRVASSPISATSLAGDSGLDSSSETAHASFPSSSRVHRKTSTASIAFYEIDDDDESEPAAPRTRRPFLPLEPADDSASAGSKSRLALEQLSAFHAKRRKFEPE